MFVTAGSLIGTAGLPVSKLTGLQRELTIYLKYYNEERAHRGRHTKGRTPLSVLTLAAGRPTM